jgi:multidrug efflux pump subunit AcrA (membrane-fusion protein)
MAVNCAELEAINDKRLAYAYLGQGIEIIQQFQRQMEYYLRQGQALAAKPRNPVLSEQEAPVIAEMESCLADIVALNAKWQDEHADLLAWQPGWVPPPPPPTSEELARQAAIDAAMRDVTEAQAAVDAAQSAQPYDQAAYDAAVANLEAAQAALVEAQGVPA